MMKTGAELHRVTRIEVKRHTVEIQRPHSFTGVPNRFLTND